ncbi:MAG: dienelactone hydrolase family protein [Abitibacteriaceae bacterium]|nr:dienelactone hydrolase family protein [Abditibacteriaceae bacterium]
MKLITYIALLLMLWGRCGWCESGPGPGTPVAQPELKTARAVATQYYLALPDGWTPQATWPILVTLEGSGHNFLRNCQAFMRARKAQPFIIVTPCVSSNGNDPADMQAVLAIAREVQQDEHGQPKFFVTGFSAGGHLAWQLILMHPELLAGAVPAAANFLGRGVTTFSTAPERAQLPIHALQGDKDPYLTALNRQWDNAEQTARAHGYQNISRTIIAGAGHSPFASEGIAFFATLLPH